VSPTNLRFESRSFRAVRMRSFAMAYIDGWILQAHRTLFSVPVSHCNTPKVCNLIGHDMSLDLTCRSLARGRVT
jgi:hypothetical protein